MKIFFTVILAVLTIVFSGCNSNENQIIDPPLEQTTKGIIIVNEGLFSQNNATLTYYSFEDNSVSNNLYSSANGNAKLGDTANDLKIKGNKGYIAVDQSFKIEIIDINSFRSLGMIDLSNFGEPRQISLVDTTMGFVTVWNGSGDGVVKFNPSTLEINGMIKVGAKPEGIVNNSNYVFAANSGWGADSTISVIDPVQFQVIKTIEVGLNPNTLLEDNNSIYVTTTGSFGGMGLGGIYKIDPSSLTVTNFSEIPGNPSKAAIMNNDLLAINSTGIIKFNLTDFSISDSVFISGNSVNSIFGTIYSVAFDSINNMIYLGNPKDFQQNGEVAVFDINGNELNRFSCGINPGTLVLKK